MGFEYADLNRMPPEGTAEEHCSQGEALVQRAGWPRLGVYIWEILLV
jgi:hypothetical protein